MPCVAPLTQVPPSATQKALKSNFLPPKTQPNLTKDANPEVVTALGPETVTVSKTRTNPAFMVCVAGFSGEKTTKHLSS